MTNMVSAKVLSTSTDGGQKSEQSSAAESGDRRGVRYIDSNNVLIVKGAKQGKELNQS
jgi:hypothetical protein